MLSRTALLNGLRLLIALAVMLGSSPLRYADSAHSSPILAWAAELAIPSDHGHSHDDEDAHDVDPASSHGHEHQDHSHVALGLAPSLISTLVAPAGRLVRLWDRFSPTADPLFRLNRPPCVPSVVA